MRHTNLTDVEMGEPVSIDNLTVHVISYGDYFDLKTKQLTLSPVKKMPDTSKIV
jgi:cyanophycinase